MGLAADHWGAAAAEPLPFAARDKESQLGSTQQRKIPRPCSRLQTLHGAQPPPPHSRAPPPAARHARQRGELDQLQATTQQQNSRAQPRQSRLVSRHARQRGKPAQSLAPPQNHARLQPRLKAGERRGLGLGSGTYILGFCVLGLWFLLSSRVSSHVRLLRCFHDLHLIRFSLLSSSFVSCFPSSSSSSSPPISSRISLQQFSLFIVHVHYLLLLQFHHASYRPSRFLRPHSISHFSVFFRIFKTIPSQTPNSVGSNAYAEKLNSCLPNGALCSLVLVAAHTTRIQHLISLFLSRWLPKVRRFKTQNCRVLKTHSETAGFCKHEQ